MQRKISCPLCTLNFPLPQGWVTPPFRCPGCNTQLQAKVRFAKAVHYFWAVLSFPTFFTVWLNGGRWFFTVTMVFYAFIIFSYYLSAQLFPLDVKPYESNIISLNLQK